MDSEDKIHQDCYVFFHNNYPELRGLLSYNLNNSKNKIDGSRNRAKGLTVGRSDLELNFKGKTTFIELKTESGVQSPDQKAWQTLMESHGFEYYIIRNLDEFKLLISNLTSSPNN